MFKLSQLSRAFPEVSDVSATLERRGIYPVQYNPLDTGESLYDRTAAEFLCSFIEDLERERSAAKLNLAVTAFDEAVDEARQYRCQIVDNPRSRTFRT